jgi:hypothetical protein
LHEAKAEQEEQEQEEEEEKARDSTRQVVDGERWADFLVKCVPACAQLPQVRHALTATALSNCSATATALSNYINNYVLTRHHNADVMCCTACRSRKSAEERARVGTGCGGGAGEGAGDTGR